MMAATTCFAQENADTAITKSNENRPGPTATGTVIHRDNKNCPVVIRVVRTPQKDTMYYLPVSSGLAGFDKEGMRITFKYRRSMIRQPMGCTGIPVMIWDVKAVSKKHHSKAPKAQ